MEIELLFYKNKELSLNVDMFVLFFSEALENISEYIYEKYKRITFHDLEKFKDLCSRFNVTVDHGKRILYLFMVRNNGYNAISSQYFKKHYSKYIKEDCITLFDLITKNR